MTRPCRAPDGVHLPQLEVVAGGVGWVAGTSALPAGTGTVVLAAGLGATGALWALTRRRHGGGATLDPARRARVVRFALAALGLVVAAGILLGALGWGELAPAVGCVLVGGCLFGPARLLDERSWVGAGALLMLLGAGAALYALDAEGQAGPQGLVGIGSTAVLWATGAVRLGLFDELRARVRR